MLQVSRKSFALVVAGVVAGLALAVVGPKLPAPHVHFEPRHARPDAKPADPKPDAKPEWFGGVLYPDNARALIASMPRLSQVAPHLLARDPGDRRPILLYKAWTDLFRDFPSYPPQRIGDCVSFAHAHGVDLLQCIEWVLAHPGKLPGPNDVQEVDTEFIYGSSREVGGMLGMGDGSYGAAAVKAMQTVGMVSRRMVGPEGAYSGARARRFGRVGPPADWKAKAAAFKLGGAARVGSWEELVSALAAGHPVTICTQRAFDTDRDANGFCRAQRCWPGPQCGGHCMVIAGARFDTEGALVLQSWGPDVPTGPVALEQPPYSFWATRAAVEAILAEGDSWALSNAPHFGAAAHARGHRRTLPRSWRTAGPAPVPDGTAPAGRRAA